MPCNLLFLLGVNRPHLPRRIALHQPHESEPITDATANLRAVLADAAREHQQVDPAQQGRISADRLTHGGSKRLQRQRRIRIPRRGALLQRLHIAFAIGVTGQTALAVQQRLQCIGIEMLHAHQIQQHTWVEIATACAHRHAAGRRQPHRRIDGLAVLQRTQTRTVAQMREHRSRWQIGAKPRDQRFVRKAVKTVANHARIQIAARQCKLRRTRRQCRMKRRVETDEMLRVAEDRGCLVDQGERRRNMQRREMHGILQALAHFGCQALMRPQVRAAMHHPMPHRRRLRVLLLRKDAREHLQRVGLRFQHALLLHQHAAVGRRDAQAAVTTANSFRTAGEQQRFIAARVCKQPELQRR
ncbi:hypothetical protein KCU90_g3125, partial [Aureobasidium melanogenum]